MGVVFGINDAGYRLPVPVTSEGHLEVAVHGPRLPFGAIHTEKLTPVFQVDAVYGLNSTMVQTTTNASGTATASDSAFVCTTGTTIYGAGSIQSRKRLRYRAGQGVVARFTGMFTAGIANSYQVIGIGHAEDGVYFGYKDDAFGILYNKRGKREVRTLTISTKSSHGENATVTLNGAAFSVAVTNGASTITTAYEISQGTYTGWKAEAIGSTVVFVADAVGAKSGTYSVAGTSVIGSFAQTSAGQATTELFIPQTSWNGDKLDGYGASGKTADWTKANVFEIQVQYLGAGSIVFKVEVASEGNNPDFVAVHSLDFPNTLTASSLGNPSFPFTMSAYSAGSTTDLTVKSFSFAGFIEGEKQLHGPRLSYLRSSTGVGASDILPLFTIRNGRYYGSRTNQSVINLLSVTAAIKHTSPVVIYVIRNATLTGSPNFTQYDTTSCSYVDSAATVATYSSNSQLIWSGMLGDTGNIDFTFEDDLTIEPGETITIGAKALTGTPSQVVCGLNTREDQ